MSRTGRKASQRQRLALIQRLFDGSAERYERDITPLYAPLAADLVAYAAPRRRDRVLDIGTGTGIADGGTARWAYVPSLREDFAADQNVIGGPDLYSVFLNHPEWLADGLHPNAAGEAQWRAAWVSWALASVYQ